MSALPRLAASIGARAVLAARSRPPAGVELWDWTLAPGEAHHSEAHRAGTMELLLVLQGEVELQAGEEARRLSAGDAACFPGDLPHRYANPGAPGAALARFALAVYEPRAGTGGVR